MAIRLLVIGLFFLIGCNPSKVGPKTPSCSTIGTTTHDNIVWHSSGRISVPVTQNITLGTDGTFHIKIGEGFYYSPNNGEFSIGF